MLACPPGLAYRLGKFVRRHRVDVSAAVVLAVMVVGFAIMMALQARQIARERDRAQTTQATAEQVTAFLVRMFEASDPSESRGDTVTARQLLETGVSRVAELDRQPEVQAMGPLTPNRQFFGRPYPEIRQSVAYARLRRPGT